MDIQLYLLRLRLYYHTYSRERIIMYASTVIMQYSSVDLV